MFQSCQSPGPSCASGVQTEFDSSFNNSDIPESVVDQKIVGVRIDPSYVPVTHEGLPCRNAAEDTVGKIKRHGGNALFLYAYSGQYGSYYPTKYPMTNVEGTVGSSNVFQSLAREAKKNGLLVIAVVPLNNFKSVWEASPDWRVKTESGSDYKPNPDIYLLSASNRRFRKWLKGFLEDLIFNNPEIDVVEAVEPALDYKWENNVDFNWSAIEKFRTFYPKSAVKSKTWVEFRSNQLMNLIAEFNDTVHRLGKKTALVQTWPAEPTGTLRPDNFIKSNTGFSFVDVLGMKGATKTDFLSIELIWQQWRSQYKNELFDPRWISNITPSLLKELSKRKHSTEILVHLELTKFSGANATVEPTDAEFLANLKAAQKLNLGVSLYDYRQLTERKLFRYLRILRGKKIE